MGAPHRGRVIRAVKQRMHDLACSERDLCNKAGIDPKTLRGFLTGRSWPRAKTLHAISRALGWSPGHLHRLAQGPRLAEPSGGPLDDFTSEELLAELLRRAGAEAAVNETKATRELRTRKREGPRP